MPTSLSKKAFREYLNSLDHLGNHRSEHTHNGRRHIFGQRTRKYGDYLYAQDREKFNVDYEEWLAEMRKKAGL